MKKQIVLMLALVFTAAVSFAQEAVKQSPRLLLGEEVPSFTAETTKGVLNFPADYGSKWKILFSHPADFTPVCSSEILELATDQKVFDKLGVKLAVVSTDPLDKHYSWKKSLESIHYQGQDPVSINFPLIDDQNKSIAYAYGMIHSNDMTSRDVRGVFIIDPDDKLAAMFYYPNYVGRNMDEIIRTVQALQTARENTVLTPANWKPGERVLLPYIESYDEIRSESPDIDPGLYPLTWYMIYKNLDMK